MILATGFGPFPGAPINPTAWLIDDLRAWRPGFELVTHTLDVTYDVWESALAPLLERHRPDAVVAFGLSAKVSGFTIETTARNVFDLSRADVRGVFPSSTRIAADGPATYASTLSLDLAHPHGFSDDAGSYICNLSLYRLLERGVRATFVHVPPFEVMPEAELRTGARAILEAAARSVLASPVPPRG